MATFKMGTKNVVSQSGTAEPTIASNVNIKDAFSTLDSSATNGPTSGTAVTKSTTLPLFGCRAWVNFDGTSVDGSNNCTIRASGNVSSVVRNSTGIYTITFATAMPDANYCVMATSTIHAGTSNAGAIVSVHAVRGRPRRRTVSGAFRGSISSFGSKMHNRSGWL